MTVAIAIEHLTKTYRLGPRVEYRTLRDAIVDLVRAPLRRPERPLLRALDDVSCEVAEGEVVGVIGANGAGKSTLLKVLSRITEPTAGRVRLRGRVGSLLEVGTGFHPELTGRENIYMNGAIIGMKRAEVARKFDEIVAFSEVERFLDTPVKHYSSGMYTRLAFAVAAHLEPDVLIVDEVLSVGDHAFQRKCMGRMSTFASSGRTVLFVSHSMGAVQGLCRRALWLSAGRVAADGPAGEVVASYLTAVQAGTIPLGSTGAGLNLERVALRNADGEETRTLRPGEDLTVEVHYQATEPLGRPFFIVAVQSQFGALFVASNLFDGLTPRIEEGRGVVACRFSLPFLLPQTYNVLLSIRKADGKGQLFESQTVSSFNVAGRLDEHGLQGELASQYVADSTPAITPYEWIHPGGERLPVAPRRHSPPPR